MSARRALVVLVAWLLAFDVATPLLPGAFRFDPGECVDGIHTCPARAGALVDIRSPVSLPAPARPERVRAARLGRLMAPTAHRLTPERRADTTDGDPPPSSSDDH
ncbi:MAG TPA: hypothetical protein VEL75_21070 [Candidatus Methylomirabilis sp.]|nr:hypothetical protein [Candidatus Methylomirabilis sp.]